MARRLEQQMPSEETVRGHRWACAHVLGRGVRGRGVVVNVRDFGVLLLFVLFPIIVAVGQVVVVVLMGVPIGAVFPLAAGLIGVIVADVIVVVGMGALLVGMVGLLAFSLGILLLGHGYSSDTC